MKIKTYLTIFALLIVASAFVTANILIKQNKELKKEIARVQNNNVQLMAENRRNTNLELSFKEFKKSVSTKIDSLLKVSEIALKEVKQVTVTNNYYIDSSKTIIRPLPVVENKDTIYPFIDIKDCFTIAGNMRVVNNRPELTIQKRAYDNETTTIGFERRPHKFWFIRWGKKETFITSSSKCGETTTKRIDIFKK